MREEREIKEKERPQNYRLKMTVAILFLAALFIIELYLMINYSESYLVMGVIGLVMLCIVYRITDLYFRIQNEKEYRFHQEYEKIFKSAKISYLFLRQSFSEVSDELEKIKNNCSMPVDELVEAQKAIAKVTINRSKENTNALMNSNDNLIDRMFAFESKLDELNQMISGNQNKEELQKIVQGMIDQQQQLSSQFREMEEDIKDEIEKKTALEESLAQKESNLMNTEDIDQLLKETAEFLNSMEDEPKSEPEKAVVVEEPEAEPEEAVVVEEPEAEPEEAIVVEEPVESVEEPAITETELDQLLAGAEAVQAAEEKPVNNDPNHVMTPDEIAALLGEVSAEAEPEPEVVEEEKPAMPDLSDPGHVMTPEEIAALLANM